MKCGDTFQEGIMYVYSMCRSDIYSLKFLSNVSLISCFAAYSVLNIWTIAGIKLQQISSCTLITEEHFSSSSLVKIQP